MVKKKKKKIENKLKWYNEHNKEINKLKVI